MSDDTEYESHELANLFDMMEGEEYESFKKDIEKYGVRDRITIYEDKILDGRNRYKAATELGIADSLPFDMYSGDDPLGFVLSKNLNRRHLDAGQRAMVAERMTNLPVGANQHKASKEGSPIGEPYPAISRVGAAKALNVSPRSVDRARKIRKEAEPEVVKAVERGEMSLNAGLNTLKPEKEKPKSEKDSLAERYALLKQMHDTLTESFNELKEENKWLQDRVASLENEVAELERRKGD